MKRILSYLASAPLLAVASIASAGNPSDYLIVKDLPFIGTSADFGSYLNGLFQLGIGIAVTLAVVMLVVNGIQYMFSDIPGVKVASKNNLGNIVWGLLLAFSAWLILYTINPNLVKFDLIRSLDEAADQAINNAPAPNASTTPTEDGAPWPSDAMERGILGGGANPPVIGINKRNCTFVGEENCTSVHGLSMQTIQGLLNLKARCVAVQPNCVITITGGTEHWAHQTHSNNATVDLSATAGLSAYLGGVGNTCGVTRTKDGGRFVWEDNSCSWAGGAGFAPHWHVPYIY